MIGTGICADLFVAVPYPGDDYLDRSVIDRVAEGVDADELMSELVNSMSVKERRAYFAKARENRVREKLKAKALAADRAQRVEAEIDWLNKNSLYKGRKPPPGVAWDDWQDMMAHSRERGKAGRLMRQAEMAPAYAGDTDLSGFTADQFDFDLYLHGGAGELGADEEPYLEIDPEL